MTVWFTSDTHFNHKNVIRYSNRPFNTVEEMNEALIANWNKVVSQNDHVYHLGDLAFGHPDQTLEIIKRLNGKKYWIKGNHDKKIRNDVAKKFQWIKDYHKLHVQDPDHPKGRQTIILFHYPIARWDEMLYNSPSWCLHGHCHANYWTYHDYIIDVGVDAQDYYPINYEQVKEIMRKRREDYDLQVARLEHGVF